MAHRRRTAISALILFYWAAPLFVHAGPDPVIQFIENKNQWRKPVLFKAGFTSTDIFLLPDRIQYQVRKEVTDVGKSTQHFVRKVHEGGPHSSSGWVSSQLVELTFLDASRTPVIEARDPAVTSYSYFIGSDRSKWGSKARGYGEVFYRQLYNGIDLRIYSEEARVKQDWIVSPFGDPGQIQIQYDGADAVLIKDGNLIVSTLAGEITELKPYAWQDTGDGKVSVACHYRLKGNVLSYALPDGYEASLPLIIDPILVFSGYSGSSYDNWGNCATYDDHGNLYSGGMITTSVGGTDFPATVGAYRTTFIGGDWDIGILKYDSSGSALRYATYVGGNGTESPHSLVVNKKGELLILGATSSTDFPVSNGSVFHGGYDGEPITGTFYSGGSDIYIAKLSEDGSALVNATYLGGSSNDGINWVSGSGFYDNPGPLVKNYGDETRGDIITDQDNNVYIATNSRSVDMAFVNTDPAAKFHGGTHDAFVAKLTSDLSSVIWNRMLGGSDTDVAWSLKLGASNDVYVAGGTASSDFAGMNGLHNTLQGGVDGWVAHISPAGDQITNATYLGTPSYDQAYFIDLNTDNEVFVYGQTNGGYPVSANVYSNPNSGQFLHKLSADLTTTRFSTVLGAGRGSPDISPTAFLVSACNTIYLSGWGGRLNQIYEHDYYVGGDTFGMPTTPNAYQKTTSGNDFYFMVLSIDAASFLYGTFLGGKQSLTHVDGGTSRFDKSGVVYHSVCASCGGYPDDFPAVNVPPARQHNRSFNCNNAAFKFDLSLLKAEIQSNNIHLSAPGISRICIQDTAVFQNKGVGGQLFQWNFGDGIRVAKPDSSRVDHVYSKTGTYTVWMKALDNGTCKAVDSASLQIQVLPPVGKAGKTQTICGGTTVTLAAQNGVTYQWTWHRNDSTFTNQNAQFNVTPKDSTVYFVKILDVNNCIVKDTVDIGVVPQIKVDLSVTRHYDCANRPSVEVKNLTAASVGDSFIDFGDGTTSSKQDDIHTYTKDGVFDVRVVSINSSCTFDKKIPVQVFQINVPNVITPGDYGHNDTFEIYYGDQPTEDAGVKVSLLIYNRWGKNVFRSEDYKGGWAGEGLPPGVYFYDAIVNNEVTCKSWLQIIK